MEHFSESNINPKDHIIMTPIFNTGPVKNLKLDEIVFTYNDGQHVKVIPYNVANTYPVIHDLYYDNNQTKKITVYICPYTLLSCIFFGEYIPTNKIYNNNLLIMDKNNRDIVHVPILNTFIQLSTNQQVDIFVRKHEVRIMTLKNAIITFPDCQFIDITHLHKPNLLIPKDYLLNPNILYPINKFSDKYTKKLLVYIIEYKSKKTHEFKYTVIVPKNNQIDINKNGISMYINKMLNDIRDKGGLMYNCLWFAWNANHPNSKVIEL